MICKPLRIQLFRSGFSLHVGGEWYNIVKERSHAYDT